jgi:hypothetical protein
MDYWCGSSASACPERRSRSDLSPKLHPPMSRVLASFALRPFFGSPEAGVFRLIHDGGPAAPSQSSNVIGGFCPIAPWGVLRCSTYANPPFFPGHPQGFRWSVPRRPVMPQPGGRTTPLHRRHSMVCQVLHEHATALSATVRAPDQKIAVGPRIAECPPHRSEQAPFRHSAPTSAD